jgi:hypothetical protein
MRLHAYEVRPHKDKRGFDLISDVLPFGRLSYGGPEAVANAVGYAKHIVGLSVPRLRSAQISLWAVLLLFIPLGPLIMFIICVVGGIGWRVATPLGVGRPLSPPPLGVGRPLSPPRYPAPPEREHSPLVG